MTWKTGNHKENQWKQSQVLWKDKKFFKKDKKDKLIARLRKKREETNY